MSKCITSKASRLTEDGQAAIGSECREHSPSSSDYTTKDPGCQAGPGKDDWRQFLAWECASRDTVDFKKIYVDMAGDLIAGLMLSQIIYWYLPAKDGTSKLRVCRDGYYWLVKGRADWWDEIRITPRQVDRALKILENKGIVVTKLYKFDNAPTKHIRIVEKGFLEAWTEALADFDEALKSNSPAPVFSPNVEMDFDETLKSDPDETLESDLDETSKSITESTSKSTTENASENAAAIAADPLLFPLARKTQEAQERAGGDWSIPPEAGGAELFANGPVDAFAEVLAGIPPPSLPPKVRRQWGRKLRQIAGKWSTEDGVITAEDLELAIRAIPGSGLGWKTYSSPFVTGFEADVGTLLLGDGPPVPEEVQGRSHRRGRRASGRDDRRRYIQGKYAKYIEC